MAQESTRRGRIPHAGGEGRRSMALGRLLLKALRWIGEALWELWGEDVLQAILSAALVLAGVYFLNAVAPKAVTDWARELPDELFFLLVVVLVLVVIGVAAGAAVLLVRGARWVRDHVWSTRSRGGEH